MQSEKSFKHIVFFVAMLMFVFIGISDVKASSLPGATGENGVNIDFKIGRTSKDSKPTEALTNNYFQEVSEGSLEEIYLAYKIFYSNESGNTLTDAELNTMLPVMGIGDDRGSNLTPYFIGDSNFNKYTVNKDGLVTITSENDIQNGSSGDIYLIYKLPQNYNEKPKFTNYAVFAFNTPYSTDSKRVVASNEVSYEIKKIESLLPLSSEPQEPETPPEVVQVPVSQPAPEAPTEVVPVPATGSGENTAPSINNEGIVDNSDIFDTNNIFEGEPGSEFEPVQEGQAYTGDVESEPVDFSGSKYNPKTNDSVNRNIPIVIIFISGAFLVAFIKKSFVISK